MEDKEEIGVPILISYDPIMGAVYEEPSKPPITYGKIGDDSIVDDFIFWEQMALLKPNVAYRLEPDNEDVESRVNLQVEEDCIRLFLHDCHENICLRFKSGEDSFKKLSLRQGNTKINN